MATDDEKDVESFVRKMKERNLARINFVDAALKYYKPIVTEETVKNRGELESCIPFFDQNIHKMEILRAVVNGLHKIVVQRKAESSETVIDGDQEQTRGYSLIEDQLIPQLEILELKNTENSMENETLTDDDKELLWQLKEQEVQNLKTLLCPGIKSSILKAIEAEEEQLWSKILQPWKYIAIARRRDGRMSLSELLQHIDQSTEEGRFTFNLIKDVVIDLGIRLSHLIINYFLLFINFDQLKVIPALTKEVEQKIQCISLEEDISIVTRMFASVINLVDKEMRNLDQSKETGESVQESSCDSQRDESVLLDWIFLMVLYLEAAFCIPWFSGMLEKEQLMDIMDFAKRYFITMSLVISDLLKASENESSEAENLKRNELKEVFDLKIKEIWKEFNFMPRYE